MKDEQVFFIGPFPGPYGGVTIKNTIITDQLKEKNIKLDIFDTSGILKKNFLIKYINLIKFIIKHRKHKGIISISTGSLIKLTNIIYIISPKILKNITVFIAGGQAHKVITMSEKSCKKFRLYKNIYVEADTMKKVLDKSNFKNTTVIPNCRNIDKERNFKMIQSNDHINCLFLSKICEDKGVNLIIHASDMLNYKGINHNIDFYGPIDSNIEEKFNQKISENKNIHYKGIFKPEVQDVYELIKGYDVVLFPSIYENEGFPGILAESKIAGVPVIASDNCYNSEIIKHMIDGIIIDCNDSDKLASSIEYLNLNREILSKLRINSFESGELYIMKNYINQIIENL